MFYLTIQTEGSVSCYEPIDRIYFSAYAHTFISFQVWED